MKNIHILPTSNLSRLHLGNSGLVLCDLMFNNGTINSQHIYITSDEEIKEGAVYMRIDTGLLFSSLKGSNPNIIKQYCKKIILTTDLDLIKDGVQAIDDEFLEWFVKNPSCEEIEAKIVSTWWNSGIKKDYYKIIIPQEEQVCPKCEEQGLTLNPNTQCYCGFSPKKEPKQEVTGVDDNRPKPNYCYVKEQGYDEIGCVFPACHCGLPIKQEEPLQETLEEAAEKKYGLNDRYSKDRLAFIEGAKWQAERMYNEVFEWLATNDYLTDEVDVLRKEFEQFKKK
jgi:hypothetical protein